MNESHLRNVIEAALLAAGKPLQPAELVELFDEGARPQVQDIQAALAALTAEYSNRGIEIKETAAGFRIQVRREMANEISRLWPERPARYSRALLETLALIAYRQPITRAEIEAVRGVGVNPNILKTVIERNWVRVVGHRDVPGRPELLGTTRDFLDYFGLKNLDDLPPLAELKVIGDIKVQFDLPDPGPAAALAGDANGAAAVEADAARVEGEVVGAAEVAETTAQVVDTAADVAHTAVHGADPAAAAVTADTAAHSVDPAAEVVETAAQVGDLGDEEVVDTAADDESSTAEGAADTAAYGGDTTVVVANAAAQVGDSGVDVADTAAHGERSSAEVTAAAAAHGADGQQVASEGRDASTASAPTEGSGGDHRTEGAAGGSASADAVTAQKPGEHPTGKGQHQSVGDHNKKPTVTRRGAPDSALYEAEEFAASIDADLAAGDDDGSDDDELSASGPGSSELVAGPRDIDD